MPRKRNRHIRLGALCPIDDAFFTRAEAALGKSLKANARTLLAFSIEQHNKCCLANEARGTRFNLRRSGRPSDANVHVFVDGLIGILEGDCGIAVTISKRQRQRDRGHPLHGPVAEFVRVVHDALILPDRNADALARLVANCATWLGRPSLEVWQERMAEREGKLATNPGNEDLIRAIKEAREKITEARENITEAGGTSKAAYINTMPERRTRRAKAREPGEAYMARMRLAWKKSSE